MFGTWGHVASELFGVMQNFWILLLAVILVSRLSAYLNGLEWKIPRIIRPLVQAWLSLLNFGLCVISPNANRFTVKEYGPSEFENDMNKFLALTLAFLAVVFCVTLVASWICAYLWPFFVVIGGGWLLKRYVDYAYSMKEV